MFIYFLLWSISKNKSALSLGGKLKNLSFHIYEMIELQYSSSLPIGK